ncbi:uncharacterized protein Nmag_4187 (plasmid) [Natrialba magadii ATCC 43099]|uniref:Uncharacterized protein n=1 Tax=Natrialba magadii (strain ATCC 43099 / DSM 3394 / CCM 3739 / CIP 104546 / IAM 13178 / JCM 8861 / NBRC 102185 / NCIMB 2190 / MS3) TaxID=547559 RepID=D3T288_NATMM|nr:uncharacterized protein Nmag_4187 [Natrialba magadii ATCC 43099]ELY26507.1 hypothetical protein C500_15130 [Natrialba magadii ATCC 43099]
MTTLHITVGDRAQLREDTLQFIQTAETDELDASNERAVLQFGTYTGIDAVYADLIDNSMTSPASSSA